MTSENINSPEINFAPKGLLIGGKWEDSSNGKTFETINPSNQKYLGDVPLADGKDVSRAVKAAKKSFIQWSKKSPYERSKYLYSLARLIQKHSRFLSVLESIDNGKPIRETRDIDIPLVARHFYYHAG